MTRSEPLAETRFPDSFHGPTSVSCRAIAVAFNGTAHSVAHRYSLASGATGAETSISVPSGSRSNTRRWP